MNMYKGHPGLNTFCKMLDDVEDKSDLWVVYELGGKPLSKLLMQTKGQFYRGERIYEVTQDPRIYEILEQNNCHEFKRVIRALIHLLSLLKMGGLVHCDFKSENILLKIDYKRKRVKQVKVIDFGTCFNFNNVNAELSLTTPEYLPPEVLEYLEFKQLHGTAATFNEEVRQKLNISKRLWSWSIDVWSLGVVVMEMIIGFPIWMSYKGRIVRGDKSSALMTGIFGVQGRIPSKIAKSQLQVAQNIPAFLQRFFGKSDICLGNCNQNEDFHQMLGLMMHQNPRLRKQPDTLLESKFLQS